MTAISFTECPQDGYISHMKHYATALLTCPCMKIRCLEPHQLTRNLPYRSPVLAIFGAKKLPCEQRPLRRHPLPALGLALSVGQWNSCGWSADR